MVNKKPTVGDRIAYAVGSAFDPVCMPFGKSLVRLYRDKYLKNVFRRAGLRPVKILVDEHTSMLCWVPKKYAGKKPLSKPQPTGTQGSPIELAETAAVPSQDAAVLETDADGRADVPSSAVDAVELNQIPSTSNPVPSGQPPLVLLHAFGPAAVFHWHEQVGPFMKAGIECFVPDLLYFGESSSTSSIFSESYQAECVFKVLQAFGVMRFDVLGVSYGGFVAYRLAQLWPQNVRKVILNDSPGVIVTRVDYDDILLGLGVEDWLDLLIPTKVEYMAKGIAITYYHAPPVPKFVLKGAMQVIFSEYPEEKRQLVQHLISWLNNPEAPLPLLSQDTLLLWGEHDQAFPLALAHRLKQFLGDGAQLVVVKRTAHQPSLERPAEYNRIVIEFLKS